MPRGAKCAFLRAKTVLKLLNNKRILILVVNNMIKIAIEKKYNKEDGRKLLEAMEMFIA